MSTTAITPDRLQNFAIFQGLSTEDLSIVAARLTYEKVEKGDQLIVQDENSHEVFFIVSGRVRVEIKLVDGKTTETLATLSTGETVGELALARAGRRTASAVTQTEAEILTCDATSMNELFDQHPAIGMRVFRNLSRIVANRLADTNMMLRNAVN